MKYLLYCIYRGEVVELPPESGTGTLASRGLAAVVSRREDPTTAPSISSLLAFAKVVETIHATRTVIPLRYGCRMESEEQVLHLLQQHRDEYEACLTRLDGLTEVGVRLLCKESAGLLPPPPLSPGAAYLASLRNRYSSQDTLGLEDARLVEWVMEQFAGWSTEQRREVLSSDQRRLLSVYFLMARSRAAEFRTKARAISPPPGVQLMVSGPWPPYNFVASAPCFHGIDAMEPIP